MRVHFIGAALAATCILPGAVLVAGQSSTAQSTVAGRGENRSSLPLTPTLLAKGAGVTPAMEGWYHGKDGFDYILLGYFNRNSEQEIDVPVGANNHIDPGGPDFGQPTHFLPGRQMGVFSIKVPKDFGTKKLLWTIAANGLSNSIVLHTPEVYIVEPYNASWDNSTPPTVKLAPSDAGFVGPPQGTAASYTTAVSAPLTLTAYFTPGVERQRAANANAPAGNAAASRGAAGRGAARGRGAAAAPDATAAPDAAAAASTAAPGGRGAAAPITWTFFRGPGHVKFANATPSVDTANGGKSETTVTFDAPGEYVLRVQGGPSSAEQCCWTSAHVKVTVTK